MKPHSAGFTLVEILVAAILLVITMVASFQFLIYCENIVTASGLRTIAANFARETMEAQYTRRFEGLALVSTDFPLTTGGNYGRLRDNYHGSRTLTINPQTGGGNDYEAVSVNVHWNR